MNRYDTVKSATHLMRRCQETTTEALQIAGPERGEWEDQAREYADMCKTCWTKCQWYKWKVAERHCSTMHTLCCQILLQLT